MLVLNSEREYSPFMREGARQTFCFKCYIAVVLRSAIGLRPCYLGYLGVYIVVLRYLSPVAFSDDGLEYCSFSKRSSWRLVRKNGFVQEQDD